MSIPVTAFPYWAAFADSIRQRRSILSHAPRHSLQPAVLTFLRNSYRELGATHLAILRPDECIHGAHVDWPLCAAAVSRDLELPSLRADDAGSFRRLLADDLRSTDARALIVIAPGTSSSVEGRFDLISALYGVLDETQVRGSLVLAGLDDYSLFYYEWWRTQGVSRWDYLHRLHLRTTTKQELLSVLSLAIPQGDPSKLQDMAVEMDRLTGGHVGLVAELCEDMAQRSGIVSDEYWRKMAPRVIERSHVAESIRRTMLEDTSGLTERAMEYEQARPVRDYNSPTVQMLRTLGVLQWTNSVSARLCPGIIRAMVRELAADVGTPDVVGTVLRDTGRSIYVPTSLDVTDDDICVVHLSDVHVGPNYAFRVGTGDTSRHDRRSAAEMLAEDLRAAGVRRVDAVVLSGDFTERAELSEFLQARDVLGGVLAAAGVSWAATVIVAGNHDIRWNSTHPETVVQASRDEFSTFRELVGKGRDATAENKLIVSKSGHNALQLISLDTNVVEGPVSAGIGYISVEALQSVQTLLTATPVPATVKRLSTWIVVHHHVFPVTSTPSADAKMRRVSVMANSAALLSYAASWGAELILHGHEHQPSITISRRWPLEQATQLVPLCVAGAGSFGCGREYLGPFARNHYFIHVRRNHDILIRSRMMGDEGLRWVPHADISVPVDSAAVGAAPVIAQTPGGLGASGKAGARSVT